MKVKKSLGILTFPWQRESCIWLPLFLSAINAREVPAFMFPCQVKSKIKPAHQMRDGAGNVSADKKPGRHQRVFVYLLDIFMQTEKWMEFSDMYHVHVMSWCQPLHVHSVEEQWDGTRWAAELPSQEIELESRAGLLSLYYGEANKVLLLAAIKSKTAVFCWSRQRLSLMPSFDPLGRNCQALNILESFAWTNFCLPLLHLPPNQVKGPLER